MNDTNVSGQHRVEIHYCTGCRWMLRATWTAQELLTTFDGEIAEMTLKPGGGGIFQVFLNGERIWCRKRDGGFPEMKHLKQRVRDRINPEQSLGHSDHPSD